MMEYIILPFSAAHIDGVEALEKACFSAPWSRSDIENQLSLDTAHFLVALIGDTVAGYIGIYEVLDCCEVANLAVLPSFRRRGIAAALLTEAEKSARGRGCEFITLEVRESNAGALSLYKKLGFTAEGRRKNFYTNPAEDGIIMTKRFNTV